MHDCPACGAPTATDSRFCSQCGAWQPTEHGDAALPPAPPPPHNEPVDARTPSLPREDRVSHAVAVAVSVVLALALIAGVIVVLLQARRSSSTATPLAAAATSPTANPTPTPLNTDDPTMQAAAGAYTDCVAARNKLVNTFLPKPATASDGRAQSSAMARADLEQATCLQAYTWPTQVQPLIDDLIDWRKQQAEYDERAAAASSLSQYLAIYAEPRRSVTIKQGALATSAALRKALGLPEPNSSTSTSPATQPVPTPGMTWPSVPANGVISRCFETSYSPPTLMVQAGNGWNTVGDWYLDDTVTCRQADTPKPWSVSLYDADLQPGPHTFRYGTNTVTVTLDDYEADQPDDGYVEPDAPAPTYVAPAPQRTVTVMVRVPNIIGMDPNTAAQLLAAAGLRMSNGNIGPYGVVSNQSPSAGSTVRPGSGVMVSLRY